MLNIALNFIKENKGGYILCGSLVVKILQGYWKSQEPWVAWGLDVGTGHCRTSIKLVFAFSMCTFYFGFTFV